MTHRDANLLDCRHSRTLEIVPLALVVNNKVFGNLLLQLGLILTDLNDALAEFIREVSNELLHDTFGQWTQN